MEERAKIEVTIDKEANLVVRVVRGSVTPEELSESLRETIAHPDLRPGMRSLTDLREATPRAKTSDVMAIADLVKGQAERLEGGKAAVVVSAQVSYGIGRMLRSYAAKSPLEIRVFYEMAEARRWLGLED